MTSKLLRTDLTKKSGLPDLNRMEEEMKHSQLDANVRLAGRLEDKLREDAWSEVLML